MSLDTARRVLNHEADAIRRLARSLDGRFTRAADLMYRTRGRIIVLGMGKPGFIAQKFSASLASTGTPSLYIHPADALHGDMGRVTKQDVLVALSKSGETEEIIRLIPMIRKIGCKLIAITGSPDSRLAKASNIVLDCATSEAEPLNVVPTTSAACMLALSDALTMALVKKRGFQKKDFALLHPGGALGKRLYLTVGAVMRKGLHDPRVRPSETMKNVLLKITAARAGSATVVDPKRGTCLGIFTDGDLRRRFREIMSDLSKPVSRYMTSRPLVAREDDLASEALVILRRKQIDELPVVNKRGKVVGLLDVQDLLKQGFIL